MARRKSAIFVSNFYVGDLLRQGEADVFLKAKATERKQILLKLLDLDFYEKLRAKSAQNYSAAKKKTESKSNELAGMPNPADEEIREINESIETAKFELQKLGEQKDAKQIEKKSAEDAEKYRREIAEIAKQKASDEKLFAGAEVEKIEKDAARFRELDKVLLRLENFWNARRTLRVEEKSLSAKRAKVDELERANVEIGENIEEKSKAANAAIERFNQAKTIFEEAKESQRNLVERGEKLRRAETLEQKIADEKAKLAPWRETFARREETEKIFDRYENLREGLSLLENLKSVKEIFDESENLAREAAKNFTNLTEEAARAKKTAEDLRQVCEAKKAAKTDAQKKSDDCRSELNRLRGKLESRNQIGGEDVCSFCGSDLTGEDAKQRLAHEHKTWQNELENLEAEEKRLTNEFEFIEGEIKTAEENAEAAKSKAQSIETKLEVARYEKEHAESEVERSKEAFDNQIDKSGDWANEIEFFDELRNDFESLADAPAQKQNLEDALKIEDETNRTVSIYLQNLGELPQVSDDERRNMKKEARGIGEKVAVCEVDKIAAENDCNKIKDEITKLKNQNIGLTSELKSKRDGIAETEKRLTEARKSSENSFAEIPSDWRERPEINDETELNARKIEKQKLQSAEDDLRNLQEANDRKKEFKAKLELLEKQLNEIPTEHRRDAVEVEKELSEISRKISLKNAEITQSNRQAEEMLRQKCIYEKLLAEQKHEARQLALWQKLAEAFGNKGLLGQIVQSAQNKVQSHANDTLENLNDDFRIELGEDSPDSEELKIYVRDERTDGKRLFEFFSGGESLLLAVSLAVAIGQATHGRNIANTLIIDEGFGALDVKNRSLMTKELKRLGDILEGVRVIVVSHQEDVIQEFPNRYEIGKDAEGFTEIKRN